MKVLLVLGAFALAFSTAAAANYPCSGGKGGVSHCSGALFVCNDGSISGSKKVCTRPQGGGNAMRGLLAPPAPAGADGGNGADGAAGDCSCRSGRICTGPRGGQYCLSDSGTKSYVRR
jgi:hypothetical protein